MAEAMLRHFGDESFEAMSAGTHPAGFVHPLATVCLGRMGIDLADQTSKSWEEYKETPIDAVITLCDSAEEECPTWPTKTIRAHWSLPDPAYHLGEMEERIEFAMRVATRLRTKIERLVELDWSASPEDIERRLRFLGEI